MEHGLIYHDVTLETPDNVRVKAYLMLQRRTVPGPYQQTAITFPPKEKRGADYEIPVDSDMEEADQNVRDNNGW